MRRRYQLVKAPPLMQEQSGRFDDRMDIQMKPERHDSPEAMTVVVNGLVIGSVEPSSGRIESTISLVQDGPATIIIDPGMVHDRRQILEALEVLAVDPTGVTDVVFSHHHPDHTLNAALFPNARVHDHRAIYPSQHIYAAHRGGHSYHPISPPDRHAWSFSAGHHDSGGSF